MKIDDKALFKIAELIAYAMFINLFLLGRAVQRVLLGHHPPRVPRYLYQGLHGHRLGSLDMVGDVHECYRLLSSS